VAGHGEAVLSAAEDLDEDSRRQDRRPRSIRRSAPVDEDSDEAVLDADETEALPAPVEDETDEEEENFSDWNVPSWSELIASLYRPDR
jgi:hypothetical protein